MSDYHPLLATFPARARIPVQWGEMDAYGHVNNTVLFRYFETARIEFLQLCGFLQSWEDHRIGAILHSTSRRFRRALFYPDTIEVGGRVSEIADDRFTMEYRVVSLEHEEIVAEGSGVIVSFDYTVRKKVPIPDDVRSKLAELATSRNQR